MISLKPTLSVAHAREMSGRVIAFGGGIPIQFQGQAIGAIGVSGGTVAEDVAVAEAGAGILADHLVPARF